MSDSKVSNSTDLDSDEYVSRDEFNKTIRELKKIMKNMSDISDRNFEEIAKRINRR